MAVVKINSILAVIYVNKQVSLKYKNSVHHLIICASHDTHIKNFLEDNQL